MLPQSRVDRRKNPFRCERQVVHLDAERPQRVVDGADDRGGRSDGAAFAQALDAELGVGRGRLHVRDADVRHLGGAWEEIVHQRRRERLALRAERHLLIEACADALRGAAADLAVDDHRVDQHAAVLDHDIVENLDASGLGIDRHHRGVGGVSESAAVALGAIAGGDLEAAGVDVGRKMLRLQIPGAPHLAQADMRVLDHDVAILHGGLGGIRLEEPRADVARAFGEQARCARHRAAAHHHRARAPGRGGVGGVERVALEHLDAIEVDAKDLVRHLRIGRLVALAVRVGADADLDIAVGGEAHGRLLVAGDHRAAP